MAIRATAIILLFSVLLVFFVPAAIGPFSAVHGPATALRANRAAQVFYFNLAFLARHPIAAVAFASVAVGSSPSAHAIFLDVDVSTPLSALRC